MQAGKSYFEAVEKYEGCGYNNCGKRVERKGFRKCDMSGMKKHITKENAMNYVIGICTAVFLALAVLVLRGHIKDPVSFDLSGFLTVHRPLLWYLSGINVLSVIAFGADKRAAVKQKRRIRVQTLLLLAFLGGAPGALLGMYLFRHKTQKAYFSIGVPLILAAELAVLFYAMNFKW